MGGGRNLDGLNALRGLAAFSIVIYHTHAMLGLRLPPGLAFVEGYFALGVPLFFVISAFSLFLSTTPRVGQENWIAAFAVRRVMRILPLFYVMAVFYLVFLPLRFGIDPPVHDFLWTLSFLFNLMPGKHESLVWAGWTIGVEMLFYATVPYLLLLLTGFRRALLFALFCTALSATFFRYYVRLDLPQGYAYMAFLSSLGIFTAGIPAWFAFVALRARPDAVRVGRTFLAAAGVMAAAGVVFQPQIAAALHNRSLFWAAVFACLVLSQCLAPAGLIANRFTVFLGRLSFGLYLCHPPIVSVLNPLHLWFYRATGSDMAGFLLSVAATGAAVIAAAYAANRLVETPGIAWGERIVRGWSAPDGEVVNFPDRSNSRTG